MRAMEEHGALLAVARDAAGEARLGAQNVAQREEIGVAQALRPGFFDAEAHRARRREIERPVEPAPQADIDVVLRLSPASSRQARSTRCRMSRARALRIAPENTGAVNTQTVPGSSIICLA